MPVRADRIEALDNLKNGAISSVFENRIENIHMLSLICADDASLVPYDTYRSFAKYGKVYDSYKDKIPQEKRLPLLAKLAEQLITGTDEKMLIDNLDSGEALAKTVEEMHGKKAETVEKRRSDNLLDISLVNNTAWDSKIARHDRGETFMFKAACVQIYALFGDNEEAAAKLLHQYMLSGMFAMEEAPKLRPVR